MGYNDYLWGKSLPAALKPFLHHKNRRHTLAHISTLQQRFATAWNLVNASDNNPVWILKDAIWENHRCITNNLEISGMLNFCSGKPPQISHSSKMIPLIKNTMEPVPTDKVFYSKMWVLAVHLGQIKHYTF